MPELVRFETATGVEVVDARRGQDALVEIRAAAVVADVVGAKDQCGDPDDLGPGELCFGHP